MGAELSPRSDEYLAIARGRLAIAESAASTDGGAAVSLAYYAMLNAANAALSERDRYARTHKGTWLLMDELFGDALPPGLLAVVRRAQPMRESTDYGAVQYDAEAAGEVIATARRFVDAVEALFS